MNLGRRLRNMVNNLLSLSRVSNPTPYFPFGIWGGWREKDERVLMMMTMMIFAILQVAAAPVSVGDLARRHGSLITVLHFYPGMAKRRMNWVSCPILLLL